MLKKILIISIISLLFLGYGCNKTKSDLDGLWVNDYEIQTVPNIGMVDYNKIMLIAGDSIFFSNIGEPKNGLKASNFKTNFKRTEKAIIIEDSNLKIFIHEETGDSLVLSYVTESSTKEVYRKLIQPNSKVDWNPKNKSYEWIGAKSLVNTTFLANGLFVDYVEENEDVSVGHWNTLDVKNNLFIILDKLFVQAVSVDSLTKNTVYLSLYNKEKYKLSFKERKLEIPKNLLGNWTLVSSDYHNGFNPPPLPNGFKLPTIEYLIIDKDSIVVTKNGSTSSKKWTLGGRNNLMIFPNETTKKNSISNDTLTPRERKIRRNILKIDSLSETELILIADYEFYAWNGFERKLKFRRGKTKTNKGNRCTTQNLEK